MTKRMTGLILAIIAIAGLTFWGCSKKSNPTEPPAPIPYTVYEGSGVVGDQGGRVQVTDSTSPIVGAFVEIPAGALTSNQTISLAPAPSGVYAPTDSSAIVVKVEPSGLLLNLPMSIGLPYLASKGDPENTRAFYFNGDSLKVEELAIDSIDTKNHVVIAQTDHFSYYYSGTSTVAMDIELVNINGRIGGKLYVTRRAYGNNYGFYFIPADIDFVLLGYPTVGSILENYGTGPYGRKFSAVFNVILKEDSWPWDKTISTQRWYIRRDSLLKNIPGNSQAISVYKYNETTARYDVGWVTNYDNRQLWYSGKPLAVKFDAFVPDPNKKYYFEVEWCLAIDPEGYFLSRCTWVYTFTNKVDKIKFSEMTAYSGDADNNYVDDSYQNAANNPPLAPSNPSPINNATSQATSLTLSWSCSDPEGDPLTYDVYFGTTNPPTTKVSSGQSVNKLSRDGLSASTAYYWYVKARDSHGSTSTGAVWKFTTGTAANGAPVTPYSPSPAANATGQQTSLSLTWACSDPENDPLFYDVYFSTANPPTTLVSQNQRTASYYKSGLLNSKDYYWKIVAKDDHNNNTPGPAWKFTTAASTTPNNPPASPSGPSPADGAANVATSITLSWSCSDPDGDALTYDVYFGKVSPPTILVSQNQTATSLARSGLDLTTGYYWRVVAKDSKGGVTNGPQWKFATTIGGTAPNAPVLASPANAATGVSVSPTLSWSDASGATSFALQVSKTNTFTTYAYNQSGLTGTSQAISGLDTVTTYYWRVRGTNEYGTSPWSIVWSFITASGGSTTIEWITIPAGNFTMGCLNTDPYAYPDEQPQHTVYLDAYQISKYEITNSQYKTFMDAGGYSNSAYWTTDGWNWRTSNSITEPAYWTAGSYNSGTAFPNHPVNGISWYEAYAFCNWAGGRLPTEAQWEKAARGTSATNYWPWGSAWDASKCNSYYNTSPDTFAYSSPVGFFATGASPYGVYDMAGNVWEWCNDWYDGAYYSVSPASNPAGPTTGTSRVFRGGGFYGPDDNCRVAYRGNYGPGTWYVDNGFRIAQ